SRYIALLTVIGHTSGARAARFAANHRLRNRPHPMPPRKVLASPVASTAGSPSYDPANPFIVQSDRSVLVEVDNPLYAAARDALAPFAELEKSPEHIHTYRITNLSLWNAAAAGMAADEMVAALAKYSKFPLPGSLAVDLEELVGRYGRVRLEKLASGQGGEAAP